MNNISGLFFTTADSGSTGTGVMNRVFHDMAFNMEHISCPLCGSNDSRPFRVANDRFRITDQQFALERCQSCRLVYQNPRVTPDTMSYFYPGSYFPSRPGRNAGQSEHSDGIVQRKCEMIAQRVDRPGRLLEIGSANGDFLAGMRDREWEVQGVEISRDAVNFSHEKYDLEVFNGDLTARPDDGVRFDVIAMWGVLPHIHNPADVFSRAAGLLADHGKLIICCANIDSFVSRYMGNDWGHLDQPRHYCMWSPVTIEEIFKINDLTLKEIIHHDDIFTSRLTIRALRPFTGIVDDRTGLTIRKLVRSSARKINTIAARPVLAMARRRKSGGIITAIGEKRS